MIGTVIGLVSRPFLAAQDDGYYCDDPGTHWDVDDDCNITSGHWLFPAPAELIYGSIASILIIGLIVWKAGPFIKKSLAARTERIQAEIDAGVKAKSDSETEAAEIRQALGDIESERQRLLVDADAQAEALLTDGRQRLAEELADLEAKAEADVAAAASRSGDELRSDIARLASYATDQVVERTLDDATQQELIEQYISRVGATGAAQ